MSDKTKTDSDIDAELIELELQDGQKLTFTVTPVSYTRYINAMMPNNKVAPAHNFLMSTVAADCKELMREMLKNPANTMALLGEVIEDYSSVEVVVKKRNGNLKT